MTKFINFIYKYNKILIIIFILINIISIYGVTQLDIETNFNVFKTENSKYLENSEVLNKEFPNTDQIIIMLEIENNQLENVIEFENYLNTLDIIKFVKGIENSSLSLPMNIKLEDTSSVITIEDKTYAILTIFPTENFNFSSLNSIENYLDDKEFTYYLSGDLYMQNKIFYYLLFVLLTIPPIAMVILFTIFRTQIKSTKATFLSILPAGIAALWSLGIAGLLGNKVSMLTVLAPIFTVIIGSADGLHFMSHLQENLKEGHSIKKSLEQTLKMIGIPMVITTITSVAGFISLIFINTSAIYDLAIFASLGITLAGIITWVILPLINSFEKLDISRKPTKFNIRINFKKLWGKPSYFIVIIIIVVSILAIPHLKTEFNQLMIYKNYTEVSKGFNKIMEVNDGTIPLFALIEHEGDPFNPEISEDVSNLKNDLLSSNSASKVYSFYNVLESIQNQLPSNIDINMLDFSSSEAYSEMISENYAKIAIFPSDLNNNTIESIVEISNQYDRIKLAGAQLMMYELNQKMITGQKTSLLFAFSLVFLSLIISLRKLIPSIFAMLPILITTLFLFGFLGITGISLNLFTTTIFSVTIGVGIDYAIHFTSIYRVFKAEGDSSEVAVQKSYTYSSRPIIANALGFAIALSALFISPLKTHLYVASLMWVSMILSSFLSLSFLPTLLKKIK